MSPSGLQKILSGANPYSATRRKLERWYAASGGEPDLHSVRSALEVLVLDLPPADRVSSMERLLKALEKSHTSTGKKPPSWIEDVRSHLAGED